MFNLYYITTAVSLIALIIFIFTSERKVLFFNASFFVFTLLANVGYLMISMATSVQEAVLAQKIAYIGACILPSLIVMMICDFCKIYISKKIRVFLWILVVIMLSLVATAGYTDFFYRNISIEKINGITCIVKDNGWAHDIVKTGIYLYAVVCIFLAIKGLKNKTVSSRKIVIMLVLIEISSAIAHFVGKTVKTVFDWTTIAYAIDDIILLYITSKTGMYNVEEAIFNSFDKQGLTGYILIDFRQRYLGSNDVAKRFLPKLNDFEIDSIIPDVEKDSPVVNSIIEWVTKFDGVTEDYNLRFGDKDYRVNVQYLYTGYKPKGYIVAISDDSERQNYIRTIEQISINKSNFLSNVSHEIRTPINSVLGMNEMILRESSENNIIEYAENIDSAGRTLLQLINDVLDVSRIESGKLQLIPENYRFRDVILDIENMISPLAQAKGLEFIIELDKNLPNQLRGDDVRLKQVIVNLMTNAVKYTDKGFVKLIVDGFVVEDNISLRIAVEDSGRGIKAEDIGGLFNSFERVDEKKNSDILGTGLGLAITKKFIELMGGHINVESVYGEGSSFIVNLVQQMVGIEKVGDLHSKDDKKEIKRVYKESFHAPNARVLVVDDNTMNLKVIQGLLKKTLIQVETCLSGAESIEKLEKVISGENDKYHIILMDHMMPEMSGVEALNIIKERDLAVNVPIVALTANAVGDARSDYMALGFTEYLSKPVMPKELEEMLQRLLPEELIED